MTVKTLTEAKDMAKSLRKALAAEGTVISHSQALELVAHQNGARDWNTLFACLSKAVVPAFQLHQRVQGRYLGQAFKGTLVAISAVGTRYAVTVRFDEPIDAVTFDSFSNIRRVVRGVVDANGISVRKASNGVPHLTISAL